MGVASAGTAVVLTLEDSAHVQANLTMDADCTARLGSSGAHYFSATVDIGAHILSMSVDGVVCDGGAAESYGWAWVSPSMGALIGPSTFTLGSGYGGTVLGGAWYSRRLLNTEVVGNFRHQKSHSA